MQHSPDDHEVHVLLRFSTMYKKNVSIHYVSIHNKIYEKRKNKKIQIK